MKIVVDSKIPYIKGVFEPYIENGEVSYIAGGQISAEDVKDADALIVRTRTQCDKHLLDESNVRIVASATIGADHLDINYLDSRGIKWVTAPGCNAGGVCQYVFTSLFAIAERKNINLSQKTIGIIGVGNVGSRVADLALNLGFKVFYNDPPRERIEGGDYFCTLEHLLEKSDIVTCHVPLDTITEGMAGDAFFSKLKNGNIFINTSRGEIVDEKALLENIELGKFAAVILDVWKNETSGISEELLSKVDIATPHIAGYSLEGKQNGTVAVVRVVAKELRLRELEEFEVVSKSGETPSLELFPPKNRKQLADSMLGVFPIWELDSQLRNAPNEFERIRSDYDMRREFIVKL